MKGQQNDINKQFSENNNKTLSSIITLIGSFIAVFYLYINNASSHNSDSAQGSFDAFFLLSALVIIVSAFLAIISAVTGYGRRRDHVVASLTYALYPKICGNGRDKCWSNYLVGVYCHLFWFFFMVTVSFAVYSFFKVYDSGEKWAIGIIGVASSVISLLVYSCNYCKYKHICVKADSYEEQKRDYDCKMLLHVMPSINSEVLEYLKAIFMIATKDVKKGDDNKDGGSTKE